MKSLLVVLLALGFLAPESTAQQVNPQEQGATIWFYRPIDSPSPRDIPTLFEIAGITRQLARLAPGEFFGYSVPPGIHVFSYTRAPARGESTAISVKANQQAYVEVHWRGLRSVSSDLGMAAIQKSRPISETSAKDESVIVGPAAPISAGPPIMFAALPIRPMNTDRAPDAKPAATPSAPPAKAPVVVTLPVAAPAPVVVTAPVTATPPVSATPPVAKPAPVAANIAPASKDVTPPAPPASSGSGSSEYVPNPIPTAARAPLGAQPFAFTEVFPKAILNIQVDKGKQEIPATVGLDRSFFWVLDKRGTALKTFPYASIQTAHYAYGKSPRWKNGNVFPPGLLASGKSHWLMVQTHDDFALIQLDKNNYKLVVAAFESRTGKKVETVPDGK